MHLRNKEIPIHRLPAKGLAFLRSLPGLQRVRRPWSVLWRYLRQSSPEKVALRSGQEICLSQHPHDIYILWVLSGRTMGVSNPAPGGDVGANIGIFALDAAWQGAAQALPWSLARRH